MYIDNYRVVINEEISPGIYRTDVYCPDICSVAKAGQFVHIKISDSYDPLLRRPLSINSIDSDNGCLSLLYRVAGKGTELLSRKKANDTLNIIGPLGKGFPIFSDRKPAIIGGGIGIAPLFELAKNLEASDVYLGFKDCVYLTDEFYKYSKNLYVCTEDGSVGTRGFPTQLLLNKVKQYGVVYTCGPKVMMKAVKEICESNGVLCFVSMEESMGCGIGACLTCSCKTNKNGEYKKVCLDGPVFNSKEVNLND